MKTQFLRLPRATQSKLNVPRPCNLVQTLSRLSLSPSIARGPQAIRKFSSTPIPASWLEPRRGYDGKSRKGRPQVRTGGSVRGTTVVWGDYGLRMCDHDRRVSAKQLSIGAQTIRNRLRGTKYKIYYRVAANIPVFTSGNEMRMGKGKGTFDYFASRISVSKIIFEVKGELHEKVVRDAFRLAAAKMPGQYEFVKRGDPPVMGITKVTDAAMAEYLKRPRLIPTINSEMKAPDIPAGVTPQVMATAAP